jgi:glycosyltransferase involved in cell wall biosynthesis
LDDSPLRVGIDGRELQGRPTGTGRYLRNLLRRWRDSGDPLVVYFSGPAPTDPVLEHPAITSRALGDGRSRGPIWQERQLAAAASADHLDILFCPAYTCPLTLRLPRVTAVHDLSFYSLPQDFSPREGFRRRLMTGLSIASSRAVLACSDFSRREIAGRFPAAADRVRHVPLGPDDDLPTGPSRGAARDMLQLQGPYVITVGAVLNRRCLPELLRAVARLAPRHPNLTLDVVGDNRTHPPLDLSALATSAGVGHLVRFSGFVDEEGLAARYAAADAAVFLSEYEGFGLPALEAASRGVPLVVSDRPALSEIFAPAALVAPPRNESAVATALDRILTEPALRATLIGAGRRLGLQYSWDRTAELTRAALREAART